MKFKSDIVVLAVEEQRCTYLYSYDANTCNDEAVNEEAEQF